MYVSILEREDRVKGVGERRKGRKERKETRGGTTRGGRKGEEYPLYHVGSQGLHYKYYKYL
jgi:hypothetical protein